MGASVEYHAIESTLRGKSGVPSPDIVPAKSCTQMLSSVAKISSLVFLLSDLMRPVFTSGFDLLGEPF